MLPSQRVTTYAKPALSLRGSVSRGENASKGSFGAGASLASIKPEFYHTMSDGHSGGSGAVWNGAPQWKFFVRLPRKSLGCAFARNMSLNQSHLLGLCLCVCGLSVQLENKHGGLWSQVGNIFVIKNFIPRDC